MKEHVEKIILSLQESLEDLDKVENGSYGYKSAAVRARKVMLESSKLLKDIRKEVQEAKNSHE
tara:strand:+ start:136 stop:324 length:189 start_codon:yes stop_codon:yes gene_type:complete